MKNVVIIGGGFAGLMVIKRLLNRDVKITLIHNHKNFVFTPRLTEILNESIQKKLVIRDIKKTFGNKINFIQESAKSIDFTKKIVKTDKRKINFDYIVLSQGSKTNFFSNKDIEKNTIDFKNLDSIEKIKVNIEKNIELISKTNKKLTIAIIGAGYSGVELILSLREKVSKVIKNYKNLNIWDCKFILIQAGPSILPFMDVKARNLVQKYLLKKNIIILTNNRVFNIKNNTILMENDEIKAQIIIWTAGVTANLVFTNPKFNLERGNKYLVDKFLKLKNYENVYVAGDVACCYDRAGELLPATAQIAFQQGINIGNNIIRKIKNKKEIEFRYKHKGTLMVLGKNKGILFKGNLILKGKLGWLIRDMIYRYRMWQLT